MKNYLCILLLVFSALVHAQEIKTVRKDIRTLTSSALWGRGYTQNGMTKTADYLVSAFRTYGLLPMADTAYRQQFSYPVNTFPGKMQLILNGKQLIPGKDFIVEPSSSGLTEKNIRLQQSDSITYTAAKQRVLLSLQNKLTWSVAPKAGDYTAVLINKNNLDSKPERLDLNIENLYIPEFKASNICGFIKGSSRPDSVILLTAHYDHLGGMGAEVFFPGANDNASGIAMLLSLARYYAKNPPAYSIGFICFAGEEAGLLGSAYYTEHPLMDLSHIKFMINMDMVGTGETGITVVNATLYKQQFALLNQINDKNSYLIKINSRGKAANSDHYYFTEKGVPAFFIYTSGGISAYHDILDLPHTLPLTEFTDLRQLLIDFTAMLTKE
jgi:aminopeptidase YwaD